MRYKYRHWLNFESDYIAHCQLIYLKCPAIISARDWSMHLSTSRSGFSIINLELITWGSLNDISSCGEKIHQLCHGELEISLKKIFISDKYNNNVQSTTCSVFQHETGELVWQSSLRFVGLCYSANQHKTSSKDVF